MFFFYIYIYLPVDGSLTDVLNSLICELLVQCFGDQYHQTGDISSDLRLIYLTATVNMFQLGLQMSL